MQDIFDYPWEFGLVLLVVLAIALELGRLISPHFRIQEDANRNEQMKTIRDGLLVLVSLLLGFTLTLAAARFAERRSLLVEEAVSVGSTYMRSGLLPQPYRGNSERLLRQYTDTRLDVSGAKLGSPRFVEASKLTAAIREELWNDAVTVAGTDRTAVTAVYLNSLIGTIDLHEKRVASFENRVPISIWLLIASVSAIAVFTRGMTLTARFWPTLVLIPVTIAIVASLIADLDSPTSGLIRLDTRAIQRLMTEMQGEITHQTASEGAAPLPSSPGSVGNANNSQK
jgi:hypothetical protein